MEYHWIIALIEHHSYAALILPSLVAQPAAALIAGAFVRLGHLSFFAALATIAVTALAGDMVGYTLGYRYGHHFVRRLGTYLGASRDTVTRTTATLHKRGGLIIFISKVTNGFGMGAAIMVSAGVIRMSLPRFLCYTAIGEIIWTGMLMAAGMYFGKLYTEVGNAIEQVTLLGAFIILAILIIFVTRLAVRKYINIS